MAGYMNPSQAESDAMAAFLANREGDLSERARLWAAVVELIKSRPKEVVEQMEQEKGLK
jgi:hypothetical protein